MRIFDFAKVADWEDRLADLAGMAEPERWENLYLPSRTGFPILDRFLRYTFIRAFEQQRIVYGDRVASFNTGLLTPGHEEIFGVFTVSENYDGTQPESAVNRK